VAALLSHQPVPRGNRVAILTNAGGPGILAADACEANGLELTLLSESTRASLRTFLPAAASVGNPIDMLASAPAEHYGRALATILEDEQVDSVIAIFIPPLVTDPGEVARAIAESARGVDGKPILGVFMRAEGAPRALSPIPCYAFPESAALALARVTGYGRWRARPVDAPPVLDRIDRMGIRAVVDSVLRRGGGWTTAEEASTLLSAAGINCAVARVAKNADEALQAAAAIGYPVAMKALGPTLLHKTERRAVCLNIADPAGLRAAHAEFTSRFADEMTSVLVQEMVPPGVEMIVGALQDPLFGPIVACGTGGVLVDLLADTAFRLHPVNESDAREMIDELEGSRLLRGYRGARPADEAALRDTLLRISELVTVAPEVHELDVNPVVVTGSAACVADVRIRIGDRLPPRAGRRVEY
jgi:acyl-CoA synthetase (NDP forming)